MSGLLVLGGVALLYLYFLLWVHRGLQKLRQPGCRRASPETPRRFSIIIAAHNEEGHIVPCLEALAALDYPADYYEVILAADRCSDQTIPRATLFQKRFERLKILDIPSPPPGVSSKKHALARGIAAARYEHLLFLDADVIASSGHLRIMNRYFSDEVAAVISLMKFTPPQHWWEQFLVYEKLLSWCIAGAGVGHQRPVIAYGGNWGYTRRAYQTVKGFAGIETVLSGDDDLLVQKMGEAGLTVRFCLEPEGWIRTPPPRSPGHFLRQRRRHFSAGKRYLFRFQVGYFLYHVSNLVIWISGWFYWPGWLLLAGKLIGDGFLVYRGGKVFREPLSPWQTLLFNPLYCLYNTLIGPLGHLGKLRW